MKPLARYLEEKGTTIDQLIEKLEQLRRQKAVLEKEEQAVTGQLRVALQKQKERLAKLGIEDQSQPPGQDQIPPVTVPVPLPRK